MSVPASLIQATLIAALTVTLSTAASGAENTSKSACAQAFDQCLTQCDLDHGEEPARRAACVPVCSGKFAACDAGVAYDKAKPWLEDQARKTKDFFDDLIKQYGTPPATETPQPKARDNSI